MCSRCEKIPNLLLQLCRQLDHEHRTMTQDRIDLFMTAIRAAVMVLYAPESEVNE